MFSPERDATGLDEAPPLAVLAFDHRAHNFSSVRPAGMSRDEIIRSKELIFDAFEVMIAHGLEGVRPGIIVDEEFSGAIAQRAAASGLTIAMPVERANASTFAFEYGDAFRAHLRAFRPAYAKALVRYRTTDDRRVKQTQRERLRELSDFLAQEPIDFMLELIVGRRGDDPGSSVDVDQLCAAMAELQDAGVRADLWKVEGTDSQEDAARIAAQAVRSDPRARCVVLGGGASGEVVGRWLDAAAATAGFAGFAIGRSIWGEPVAAWLDGSRTREQAIEEIASTCRRWALRYVGERNR